MKNFEDEMGWTERKIERQDYVAQIKERIIKLLSKKNAQASIEDKYELESCRTLEYEMVTDWILRNKTEENDGALLVRLREKNTTQFPIVVGIMFLHENQVCLGKEHNKKIVHCTYLSEELDKLFEGKESLILK